MDADMGRRHITDTDKKALFSQIPASYSLKAGLAGLLTYRNNTIAWEYLSAQPLSYDFSNDWCKTPIAFEEPPDNGAGLAVTGNC